MISSQMRSIVAESCPGFEEKYIVSMLSMGNLAQSCNDCANYANGRCNKDLFNSLKEKIERN